MSLYSPEGWLFIHVRKTGGTTLRNLLFAPLVRYLTIPHDPAYMVKDHLFKMDAIGHWNIAFKFAFVRDPYTWVESMRRHCIAQQDHPLNLAANDVEAWPERLAQACETHEPTTDGILCFQSEMVTDHRGNTLVDRLCRFENYPAEIEWLSKHLGFHMPRNIPTTGAHSVPMEPVIGQYRESIAHFFSDDFNALGYQK
jgi:chondroitin 4-sulfotransferase 11